MLLFMTFALGLSEQILKKTLSNDGSYVCQMWSFLETRPVMIMQKLENILTLHGLY